MKRLLLVGVSFALFAACGDPKKTCKDTGCSAGAVCNAVTGVCEATGIGGGTGGGTAGGNGGGGGTTGGGTGGGTAVDAGFDAGVVVDPFDDGGVFTPGDICTYAIPVNFDGGTTATLSADLSTAQNQYDTRCAARPTTIDGGLVSNSGNDLVFAITLTEPKGLIVTATSTGAGQDSVIALISSPCASFNQVSCADNSGSSAPEVLTVERLPAGTWYVVLENYQASTLPGPFDVQFELVAPVAGPVNDTCATAQELTFTNGAAMASGTTVGSLNDSMGAALTCSSRSTSNPEVFYKFTLTQDQDVRVTLATPTTSNLSAAVALTTTCGVGGAAVEKGCDSNGSPFLARGLAAGTYYIVVEDDGFSPDPGEFTLDVALLPASMRPANDTCTTPAPLTVNQTVMIDVNAAAGDYMFSCANPSGSDVVYSFTTTMAQKVTVTATGMNGADAVLSLRGAPCDMDTAEVACRDDGGSTTPEVLSVANLPAGTYYVVLAAYRATAGEFALSLALDAPVPAPGNDACGAPALLAANVSQNVDLAGAASDYAASCAGYAGGDAVYTFTTTMAQKVVLTATGMTGADAVLELRSGACDPGTLVSCSNAADETAPEVLTVNNLPAGTYYVLLGSTGVGTQFGLALTLAAAIPPPTNDTCLTAEPITLNTGMATRSVDLTFASADISEACDGLTGTGNDVVYSVVVPANQRLTVTAAAGSTADPVLYIRTPDCATTPSVVCADVNSAGGAETATVLNGATMATYFVVVKAYRVSGIVDLMFAVGP